MPAFQAASRTVCARAFIEAISKSDHHLLQILLGDFVNILVHGVNEKTGQHCGQAHRIRHQASFPESGVYTINPQLKERRLFLQAQPSPVSPHVTSKNGPFLRIKEIAPGKTRLFYCMNLKLLRKRRRSWDERH